jgi:hypothetical protein
MFASAAMRFTVALAHPLSAITLKSASMISERRTVEFLFGIVSI